MFVFYFIDITLRASIDPGLEFCEHSVEMAGGLNKYKKNHSNVKRKNGLILPNAHLKVQ